MSKAVVAQPTAVDTVGNTYEKQLSFFNRQFDNLNDNAVLNDIERRFNIEIKSIISCLMVLDFAKDAGLDFLQQHSVMHRLEEIADTLIEEGTPTLISGNGMNSVENAILRNAQPNKYHLFYISTGNHCISNPNSMEDEGIEAFNRRTLDRLGLESFPPRKTVKESVVKKKKKKGA